MSDNLYALAAILIIAAVTALTRWTPFLLFGGKKTIPPAVRRLGDLLPGAIMVILVVYCLRGADFSKPSGGLAQLIAVAITVGAQIIKKNSLLSIFLGTASYMALIRLM